MDLNQDTNKSNKQVLFFAVITLIFAPLIYLVVAFQTPTPKPNPVANEFLLYILLIVAVFEPAIYPLIERVQITVFKKNRNTAMSVYNLYKTCSIIKFAMVEMVFILSLVTFFVLGTTEHIWKFYIIGIFWVIIYWPRKTTLENFITKAGDDGIQR